MLFGTIDSNSVKEPKSITMPHEETNTHTTTTGQSEKRVKKQEKEKKTKNATQKKAAGPVFSAWGKLPESTTTGNNNEKKTGKKQQRKKTHQNPNNNINNENNEKKQQQKIQQTEKNNNKNNNQNKTPTPPPTTTRKNKSEKEKPNQQQQQKEREKKKLTNITSSWGAQGPITFKLDQATSLNQTIEAINQHIGKSATKEKTKHKKTQQNKKFRHNKKASSSSATTRKEERVDKDGFKKPKTKTYAKKNHFSPAKAAKAPKTKKDNHPKQEEHPAKKKSKTSTETGSTKDEKIQQQKIQTSVTVPPSIASKKPGAWLTLFPDDINPNFGQAKRGTARAKATKKIIPPPSMPMTNEKIYKQHASAMKKREKQKNGNQIGELPFDLTIPMDSRPHDILPRGLKNTSNTCWVNVVLQMFLYIPEFYHLVMRLDKLNLNPNAFPLTTALAEVFAAFPIASSKQKSFIQCNALPSFDPDAVINFLAKNKKANSQFVLGQQHDAQEFASFVIQHLHEELALSSSSPKDIREDGGWMEVNQRGRGTNVVNEVNEARSLVSALCSGRERSLIRGSGVRGSLTIQPYFMLHLPIPQASNAKNVPSLQDCFDIMTTNESLGDASSRIVTLESPLPKILFLQLKRFQFSSKGIRKRNTRVRFSHQLRIDNNWLSPSLASKNQNYRYELLQVIIHSGSSWEKGHYSIYVRHPEVSDKWIHLDDERQTVVSMNDVETLNPYMFIYRRLENAF